MVRHWDKLHKEVVESLALEVFGRSGCGTWGHGLGWSWWHWVGSWTGWPWGSLPTVVTLSPVSNSSSTKALKWKSCFHIFLSFIYQQNEKFLWNQQLAKSHVHLPGKRERGNTGNKVLRYWQELFFYTYDQNTEGEKKIYIWKMFLI